MKQDLVKSSVQRDNDGVARISSRDVAEIFDKEHFHVLRDIKNLECSEEFKSSNFGFVEIIEKTAGGAKYNKSYCTMTRDGFTFLAMGFSGKRAAAIRRLLLPLAGLGG